MYFFFFFKQKTAYEMRISDWSSDVCSSDLVAGDRENEGKGKSAHDPPQSGGSCSGCRWPGIGLRSEEHTSELQSLMRISYAVFCCKKKNAKFLMEICIHGRCSRTSS